MYVWPENNTVVVHTYGWVHEQDRFRSGPYKQTYYMDWDLSENASMYGKARSKGLAVIDNLWKRLQEMSV